MASRPSLERAAVRSRSGFTLIEMLVVILLVVLMTSILVPVLSSASDARRNREGARVLSAILAGAQMQAEVSGRSAGVWIQRLKGSSGLALNSSAAMDLYMCEVPPPYVGDFLNSTANINGSSITFQLATSSTPTSSANLGVANVQNGDLIRFSYRGELYYLGGIPPPSSPPPNNIYTATITPLDQTQTLLPPNGTSLPFQIYRRPIKTSAAAVQLTEGVGIDLNFSGIDFYYPSGGNPSFASGIVTPSHPIPSLPWDQNNPSSCGLVPTSAADAGEIIITFSPTGALDLVYIVPNDPTQTTGSPPVQIWSPLVRRPITGVYLLVGKIERIPVGTVTTQNPHPANWQDMDCRWVAVNRQSGLTTTAEVASTPSGLANPPSNANVSLIDITSVRFARGNQSMGGN